MTRKICRFMSVALSVILILATLCSLPVFAQTTVNATLSLDKEEYQAGDNGYLNVSFSGITSSNSIAAMDFYITYDSSVLSVEKSSNIVTSLAGSIVPTSDDVTVTSIEDGVLKVLFFGSNMATIDSITQNGTFLTIPFTVNDNASNVSSSVTASFANGSYSEGQACTAEGVDVPVAFQNKNFSVYTPAFTNPYDYAKTDDTSYESQGYISGFTVGDSITNVKADFEVKQNATITVKDSKGNTVANSSPIGTGMVITIDDGVKSVSFTAVVFGDVDGDGIINTMDSANIDAYLASTSNPQGPFALAHDLDKNGNTDTMDTATMDAYLASLLEIEQ